jgi:hypothetical protein
LGVDGDLHIFRRSRRGLARRVLRRLLAFRRLETGCAGKGDRLLGSGRGLRVGATAVCLRR